jgi:hypothetical protein
MMGRVLVAFTYLEGSDAKSLVLLKTARGGDHRIEIAASPQGWTPNSIVVVRPFSFGT